MQDVLAAWNAIKFGGAMVYPLLALGVIAIAIIIDRAVLYSRCLRLPVGTRQPGRDVRIFVGRTREAVERTRAAQRIRTLPSSDRRQSQQARVVGRIASRRRGRPDRKDAGARTVGARDGRDRGSAARAARHDHGHDAVLQCDRRVDTGRAHAGDGGRRAGADRDRARSADRGARAVRVQPVLADAIAVARHDGAAGLASGRSYTARSGRRRGGAYAKTDGSVAR